MQTIVRNSVRFFLFLGVSAFLFWLVYRDQDWSELMTVLREDVDYTWVAAACVMGIASHVSRALRWQMLTESMGYRIRFWNAFMGVMVGYFANLAIPRMGEFTRCGVVGKYEGVPFSKLLGTVVTERVIDMMLLLGLTLVALLTQFSQIGLFLEHNPGIGDRVETLLDSAWVPVAVAGLAVLSWAGWRFFLRRRLKERVDRFVQGLKEGLLAFRNVRRKSLFIGHSLFIWLMYFLMFYVCFFCFEFTSRLGPLVGLAVFVLSCYGMVAPVQGGIGAWHFMVIAALMIYMPDVPDIASLAKAFALLTHSSMTLLYIVVGVVCLLALPVYNLKNVNKRKTANE